MVYAGCVFVALFTYLGHDCPDLLESVWWNACVHILDLGLYSHPKEILGNGVRTHFNSKGKIPSSGKIPLRGGSNPQHCIRQDSEPNTLPTELFRSPNARSTGTVFLERKKGSPQSISNHISLFNLLNDQFQTHPPSPFAHGLVTCTTDVKPYSHGFALLQSMTSFTNLVSPAEALIISKFPCLVVR